MTRGNCAGYDDDTMFPDERYPKAIESAKSVCEGCPIRTQCLAGALLRGEEFGIWGGLTAGERASLLAGLEEAA